MRRRATVTAEVVLQESTCEAIINEMFDASNGDFRCGGVDKGKGVADAVATVVFFDGADGERWCG